MKLSVKNKTVSVEERQKHLDRKKVKKDIGSVDVYALAKYIRKLEKRIEVLEQK